MNETIQKKALSFSIIDGALSSIMGSLVGGIFLTGFAIKILKAQPQQIGVLAALPMLANLVQIFGSYIIEKTGKRRSLCLLSIIGSRILWIIIIMLPLKIFETIGDFRVWALVGVIGLSGLFGSLAGVAWLSWMSELVPENIRGSYFGKRNMIASFCGMVFILLGGKFLTLWESKHSGSNPFGFIILFGLGLIAGLIAIWFLFLIPEVEGKAGNKEDSFDFLVFVKPLKDRNFLTLIVFVSVWMFAIQIAAPFYGVFMIENLKINFSAITVFGTFATFATLVMMKIWGPISDKLGNKPVIIVSGWVLILVPFIWIVAVPERYYFPILTAHILSGAFMAGATLSQFNILIKLSPQEGRSVYFALFAAITGSFGALAPIIGGSVSQLFSKLSFQVMNYNVSGLHFIFLISSVLQILTIFFIVKVKEPAASTPVAVIMQLKNDLNPQTGIAGVADFVMVKLEKSENILKRVDDITETIADKSEQKIEKAINKGENIIKKPLEKIKEFLKEDK
ncbi:MAG: MFS transporter [Endomicrobiales bacterium]|nr:MFS transporter [Endomicrobiales bacterium]